MSSEEDADPETLTIVETTRSEQEDTAVTSISIPLGGPIYVPDLVGSLTTVPEFEASVLRLLQVLSCSPPTPPLYQLISILDSSTPSLRIHSYIYRFFSIEIWLLQRRIWRSNYAQIHPKIAKISRKFLSLVLVFLILMYLIFSF